MSLPPTACSHVARICASGFTFTSIPLFRGRSSEVHCSTCDLMSRLHFSRCLAQDCIFSSFSIVSSPAAYTYICLGLSQTVHFPGALLATDVNALLSTTKQFFFKSLYKVKFHITDQNPLFLKNPPFLNFNAFSLS